MKGELCVGNRKNTRSHKTGRFRSAVLMSDFFGSNRNNAKREHITHYLPYFGLSLFDVVNIVFMAQHQILFYSHGFMYVRSFMYQSDNFYPRCML